MRRELGARLGIALLGAVLAAFVALVVFWERGLAVTRIEQPIAFSHELHAGQKQIPCQYCHAYARRSIVAGVPPVQTCMGCHELVAVRKPEIRKLRAYWEQQAPIPWIKIHNLPDFVHFSHKRHVQAGVPCQECHGPVETMAEVYQHASLQMGWCVTCHLDVQKTHRFGAKIEPSVDCATCHK